MNTLRSMRDCLALARKQHGGMDLALATGDLTHDGSIAAYQRLRDIFSELQTPVYAIPGNHDDPHTMHDHMACDLVTTSGRYVGNHWQIILLDSSQLNSEAGYLADIQLHHLEHCLQQSPNQHALICLHHPPVATGSAWLDTMQLQNCDEFFKLLGQHNQVRAVLCGHIHQELQLQHQNVKIIASPSTCIQFKPHSSSFSLDPIAPGYRWLALHKNGNIDTGVCRLPFIPDVTETDADGY
jgi:Icc protein